MSIEVNGHIQSLDETIRAVIDQAKSDPRYNFEERVQRLMKKGNTRDEAEAVVLTVIATKEMP